MGLRSVGIWALLPFLLGAMCIFLSLDMECMEKERLKLENVDREVQSSVVAAEMAEVEGGER